MENQLQKIAELCRENRIDAMYVFGSRSAEILQLILGHALDLPSSASDLDIGVLTSSPLPVSEKVDLSLALEELFHVSRVDLVVLQEADAFLAANIIRGERIFADDSYRADEYELFVLRRAGDLAELERKRMATIIGRG